MVDGTKIIKINSIITVISLFLVGCSNKTIEPTRLDSDQKADKIIESILDDSQYRLQEIKVKDSDDAELIIKNQLKRIESRLVPQIDPYTGRDSLPSRCLKKNLPEFKKFEDSNQLIWMISMYASKNFILGCSSKDDLAAQVLLIYCKDINRLLTFVSLSTQPSQKWPTKPMAECFQKNIKK